MIVVANRGSMTKHTKHARKHDGSRNVSRLKRSSLEVRMADGSQVKQTPRAVKESILLEVRNTLGR